MKKTLILIISILAITAMTSAVYAGTYTGSDGTISIGGASDSGGALNSNISPSVLVSVITTTDEYGICAVNPKAGTDAIGYNVHSGSGSVFMKTYTTAPTAADTPTAGSTTPDYNSK